MHPLTAPDHTRACAASRPPRGELTIRSEGAVVEDPKLSANHMNAFVMRKTVR